MDFGHLTDLEGSVLEMIRDKKDEFIVIDICPKCGKITVTNCKHNSCYNNQCECGYLTGFIGRNHAN